jgi:anti-anti-sigma regulatory factor
LAAMPDLTPLALRREGNRLEFVLRTQDDILGQLPDDYEARLSRTLDEILAGADTPTATINLDDVPGLSSRQLGSLIALGKVLRPRFGTVPLVGVSPSVRHLLEMTRTNQLFQLDPT